MKISVLALRHPVSVSIITAAAILAGLMALFSLRREFIPTITEPSALVVTIWPGSAAEEVESRLTSVLEDHFAVLQGLVDMRSESREGLSLVRLQFDERLDVDLLIQEVRNQIDKSTWELPADILGKPVVSRIGSMSIPVYTLAVTGPMDTDALYTYVDTKVVPEIYKVEGVAQVHIYGDYRKVLEIRLNTEAMNDSNITALEVLGALRMRGVSISAGLVEWDGKEWPFQINGEFSQLSDIENLIISPPGTVPVTLAEIADIAVVYSEAEERIRSGGRDFLVLHITKRDEGHMLRMSEDIRGQLSDFDELSFITLHDDAKTVRQSLATVTMSALAGLFMAMAVILLFLREWHYTAVIGASLPISLMTAFACMWFSGMSINVLTMAGITISLGMVVDASIVVLENIHRHRAGGADAETASRVGTVQIAGAVTAFVITSVCVFLPMLFLKGIIGSVLKDLSLTLIFILCASLFSAVIIIPLLARNKSLPFPMKSNRRIMSGLERLYRRSLIKTLRKSPIVIVAALTILIASVYVAGRIGISFIPAADYNELFISMKLKPGSTLDESAHAADMAERIIRKEVQGIDDVVFYVGMEDDLSGDSRTREALWGQVLLKEKRDDGQDFRSIIRRLNEVLIPAFPDISIRVLNGGFDRLVFLATNGPGFRVELSSDSAEDLNLAVKQVSSLLLQDPEIMSIGLDVEQDRVFLTARLNQDSLNKLNIAASDTALTARIAFGGINVGNYQPDSGPARRIILNSDLQKHEPNLDALTRLRVRNRLNQTVSFDEFAEVAEEQGVASIIRHDRKRIITVIGYTESENIRDINRRFKDGITGHRFPPSVNWRIEGVGGLINDSIMRLGIVLMISLFLVYAVMAIQFEKLMQPLIIMAVVPFCFIGVVGGLVIFGSDISLISFLGIVALGGLVVNNAIVQVDRINQLRRNGLTMAMAIVEGSVSRLRPILMTTLTTFFGILPLALTQGIGTRIYAPLGQAIAGGLAASTLVTLFLIPVLYRIVEYRRNDGS